MTLLVLKDLNKAYKQGTSETHVLKNVNFKLKKSQVVALVAPSGSGKTTLLQMIGLIDSPTSGEVIFDGMKSNNMCDRELTAIRRDKIGFVFQFHHLMPEFSALENVMMPLLVAGIERNKAMRKAREVLDKMSLTLRLNNLPTELSGGEQQRVAIARALVHDPVLLLADEPTGNLDHKNALQVMNLMLKEVKKRKLAIVVVTHNAEMADMADTKYTIEEGKVKQL